MDGGFILVFLILAFTLFLMWRGYRFIRCAWCGRTTGQRDRSGFGDSSGICPACVRRLRGR